MAVLRDRPYGQFNFLVDLGTGVTEGPEAGFQECSEISMSVDVIEYRNGNDKENGPRKVTGLNRVADVTLGAASSAPSTCTRGSTRSATATRTRSGRSRSASRTRTTPRS